MAKIDDSVKKKVPELRFKGFTDDWEERKLGELSNIVGGGTPSTSNPEYWDGDIDWYAPAEIGEQSYVSKSKKTITELGLKKSSARILPVGTVLFTSRAGIGNTAILAKEATTNQGFQSIVPVQNKLDSYFIFSRTNELKRYGEVTGAGSTFVEVSGKQMSKMSIMVPELSEQQKIGSFFKQLDDTIALHQRKLDLLKEQKKGYLQKMFPKNGAKVPELRFTGFADDWEERKLSEGTSKIGDGLHGTPNYSDNGDVFFINGNNLVNGKIVITKETKLVTESNQSKDDKLLNTDTILMSINGTIGNLAWYNNERVMLGKSAAYLTVSNFDKKFIFSYLQTSTIKNYFLNNLTGTTIKNLGLKTIRDTTLFVPTLEEQQQIGEFFWTLEETIALHQRKLDLLKEQKKGFLQKMFV
ncbi:restriction endonuclease subunit S [Lactococcus lactis]|uniref:restriction endonuclease subunit S n=2 Tax=Lactococcus lactis TaxID=1358 RepID=UPI0025A068D9|nr:restriction endonuclease subunit S [Lactococcus lactis]MDM7660221.1 restriction endonuclease subunit S [Lactococcus lactis]